MSRPTVVGIDVGGPKKGFHVVVLQDDHVVCAVGQRHVDAVATLVRSWNPTVVAIDSPCRWSVAGASRACERALPVRCFYTPTEAAAEGRAFYDWVRNGFDLIDALADDYPVYDGERRERVTIETFPRLVSHVFGAPFRPKLAGRRRVLAALGWSVAEVMSIDFVDAMLCAVAGASFASGRFKAYGDANEGYIVAPTL